MPPSKQCDLRDECREKFKNIVEDVKMLEEVQKQFTDRLGKHSGRLSLLEDHDRSYRTGQRWIMGLLVSILLTLLGLGVKLWVN